MNFFPIIILLGSRLPHHFKFIKWVQWKAVVVGSLLVKVAQMQVGSWPASFAIIWKRHHGLTNLVLILGNSTRCDKEVLSIIYFGVILLTQSYRTVRAATSDVKSILLSSIARGISSEFLQVGEQVDVVVFLMMLCHFLFFYMIY